MTQTIEQLIAELRDEEIHTFDGFTVADVLEQLTARVRELEAEVERLSAAHVKACQANADSQTELAKAEQRVAEACSKWIDGYSGIHQKEMLSDTAKSFSDALRRGEWRKFLKEM